MLVAPPTRHFIKLLACLTVVGGSLYLVGGILMILRYGRSPSALRTVGLIAGPAATLTGLGSITVAVLVVLRPTVRVSRYFSAFLALLLCLYARAALDPILPKPSVGVSFTAGDSALLVADVLTLLAAYPLYRALRAWVVRAPDFDAAAHSSGGAA
jgi:hypothetical protein